MPNCRAITLLAIPAMMLSRISISRSDNPTEAALLFQSPPSAAGTQLVRLLTNCDGNTFSPNATSLIDSTSGAHRISLTMTASTPI